MALSQNEDNNYYLIQQDAIKTKYLMVAIHSKCHINKYHSNTYSNFWQVNIIAG